MGGHVLDKVRTVHLPSRFQAPNDALSALTNFLDLGQIRQNVCRPGR